jgi:hypothetical protein
VTETLDLESLEKERQQIIQDKKAKGDDAEENEQLGIDRLARVSMTPLADSFSSLGMTLSSYLVFWFYLIGV